MKCSKIQQTILRCILCFIFQIFLDCMKTASVPLRKLNASLAHSLTYDVYKRDSTQGHCFLTLVHAINPLTITIYGDDNILSTHCILGNLSLFCRLLLLFLFFCCCFFFQNESGIPSECQTVWTLIRSDDRWPDLGPNCLPRYQQTTLVNKELIQNNIKHLP